MIGLTREMRVLGMLTIGGVAAGAVGLATLSSVTSLFSPGMTTFLWLVVATLGVLSLAGWIIGCAVAASTRLADR